MDDIQFGKIFEKIFTKDYKSAVESVMKIVGDESGKIRKIKDKQGLARVLKHAEDDFIDAFLKYNYIYDIPVISEALGERRNQFKNELLEICSRSYIGELTATFQVKDLDAEFRNDLRNKCNAQCYTKFLKCFAILTSEDIYHGINILKVDGMPEFCRTVYNELTESQLMDILIKLKFSNIEHLQVFVKEKPLQENNNYVTLKDTLLGQLENITDDKFYVDDVKRTIEICDKRLQSIEVERQKTERRENQFRKMMITSCESIIEDEKETQENCKSQESELLEDSLLIENQERIQEENDKDCLENMEQEFFNM